MRQRRKFTREFKVESVRLSRQSDSAASSVFGVAAILLVAAGSAAAGLVVGNSRSRLRKAVQGELTAQQRASGASVDLGAPPKAFRESLARQIPQPRRSSRRIAIRRSHAPKVREQ